MTGMDWSGLAPTALGGVLALGGGFGGQWWAERRAIAREQRDREHEREVWARGLRHNSHVEFLRAFESKYQAIADARGSADYSEPPEDYLTPVWDRYQSLRMVCTAQTATTAEAAYLALNQYAFRGGIWQDVEYRRDLYLGSIREEFGLPPVPLMGD